MLICHSNIEKVLSAHTVVLKSLLVKISYKYVSDTDLFLKVGTLRRLLQKY